MRTCLAERFREAGLKKGVSVLSPGASLGEKLRIERPELGRGITEKGEVRKIKKGNAGKDSSEIEKGEYIEMEGGIDGKTLVA